MNLIMSLHLDLKYTLLLSPRFERYQRKKDHIFNVRCPLCGDSKTNKSKMRGYIFNKKNNLVYYCHNCHASMSVGNLIKQLDPSLYNEYVMEKYKSGQTNNSVTVGKTITIKPPKFDTLQEKTYNHAERCDLLPEKHFCKQYLKNRKIPEKYYNKLYYCDNFSKFCEEIRPNHDIKISSDKRLVIPFFDEYNELIAVSGRALENADEKLRYVTMRTSDSENKLIYGIDRLKKSAKVLLVEGPIDSLFLNNCLASGDANLALTSKSIDSDDIVLIYDREPRNKEILKMMERAINDNFKIVIWPDTIIGKDINEMVIQGLLPDEIEDIISKNTFSGIQAQLKFNMWKKV